MGYFANAKSNNLAVADFSRETAKPAYEEFAIGFPTPSDKEMTRMPVCVVVKRFVTFTYIDAFAPTRHREQSRLLERGTGIGGGLRLC